MPRSAAVDVGAVEAQQAVAVDARQLVEPRSFGTGSRGVSISGQLLFGFGRVKLKVGPECAHRTIWNDSEMLCDTRRSTRWRSR